MSTVRSAHGVEPTLNESLADRLGRARERTLELIGSLSETALNAVHDPLMSPIVWDLGHVANFEELWLVCNTGGVTALRDELETVYDPTTAPRTQRGGLPYLRSDECLAYAEAVRGRTLESLEDADLSEDADPLLANGFVYELVLRHEQQHSETILQTLQIMTSEPYRPERRAQPSRGRSPGEMVLVEGGPFEMGAAQQRSGGRFAYDNECPAHVRDVDPFWIDAQPVTNGEFIEFVEETGAALPKYWERDGDGYVVRSFATHAPVDPALPVCHVSWHEADAYARWAGKRLPSEAEWEKAASWDATAGEKRAMPWGSSRAHGRANLDQLGFGTAPAGAYDAGASPCGALGMAGDVWEWTGSGFSAYDGFRAFPYPEYSEPFFDGPYKVLRGGSWATQPDAVTTTFRNWDYPQRRQIFAGFRCARDAEPAAVAGGRDAPAKRRVRVDVHERDDVLGELANDVRAGLTNRPKALPPKYFYDDRGSALFEAITGLPEYYPTRAEQEILDRAGVEIVETVQPAELVELGPGSARKTHALLDPMISGGFGRTYVPVDVSEAAVRESAARLERVYASIEIHGVVGDFEQDLERLECNGRRRLVAFLGGTLGNLDRRQRKAFLTRLRRLLGPDDRLLIGTDLVKDRGQLEAAYNDSAGVTAEFNRNVLRVINENLDGELDPERFEHVALYDEQRQQIEMRLRARESHAAMIHALSMEATFERGEEILTEISCKFTRERLTREYAEAGLRLVSWYTDPQELFGLSLIAAIDDES